MKTEAWPAWSRQFRRLDDWPEKLAEFIRASRSKPFAWGTHDCVLFGVEAVYASVGVDLALGWRGTYSDALGAEEALRKFLAGDSPAKPASESLAQPASCDGESLSKSVDRDPEVSLLETLARKYFGAPLPSVRYAQRGDLALFCPADLVRIPATAAAVRDVPGLTIEPEATAVVLGRHAAVLTGDGMKFIPARACSLAWRV